MQGIPTREQCYKLLEKYHFPERKRRHVELVASVAKYLATKLKTQNSKLKTNVNVDLIEAAALLHDIDKGVPGAGEIHPKVGVAILRQEGYEEIADLVVKHSLPAILADDAKPTTWNEKVLFLADKMVKNEVMTVDERFRLWREEEIDELNTILDQTYPQVKALEKEFFGMIGIKPEEVKLIIETVKVD